MLGCDLRRDAPALRRRVGMLGHAAALYDDLTVVENVRFARARRGRRLVRTSTRCSIASSSAAGCGARRWVASPPANAGAWRLALLVARRPRAVAPRRASRRARRRRPGGARARSWPRRWPAAPRCSWRRTNPRSRGRWPTGSCRSWVGASSGGACRAGRRHAAASAPRSRFDRFPGVPMWRDTRPGGGQGPAHRAALARRHAPGGAGGGPRPRPLRLRARARPRPHGPCRARPVLGGGALRQRARRAAQLRARGPRRAPATGCACRGSIPPGCSWARPPRWRCRLVVLEVVLTAGVVVLYGSHVRSYGSIVAAGLAGTAGLAAAGTLYGALAAGLRVRETLLPFLFLPVAAPVLLAGDAGLAGRAGDRRRQRRRPVAPAPARLRRGVPRPGGRHLRSPAGGVVSARPTPTVRAVEPARHVDRARPRGRRRRWPWPPRSGSGCG